MAHYIWERWNCISAPDGNYTTEKEYYQQVNITGEKTAFFGDTVEIVNGRPVISGGAQREMTFDDLAHRVSQFGSDWEAAGVLAFSLYQSCYEFMNRNNAYLITVSSSDNSGDGQNHYRTADLYKYTAKSGTAYSKGTTSYGTVSSTYKSAYPENGRHNDGYWYVLVNSSPTATLTLPTTKLYAGCEVKLNWVYSDPDGDSCYARGLKRYIKHEGEDTYTSSDLNLSGSDARSYTDTVPEDAGGALIYYALEFDDGKCVSQYALSLTASITANTAPSVPGRIKLSGNVSGTVISGTGNLTVSWLESTDAENNLAGYILQRSVSGGAFEEVYRGISTSFIDTVLESWTSVAYRVQAYDTLAAKSTFWISTVYKVNVNHAPVITAVTSVDESGGLGIFTSNTAPDLVYKVADTDGDKITVKEFIDDIPCKTNTTPGDTKDHRYSFTKPGTAAYQKLLNGTHVYKIEAQDEKGAVSVLSVPFTKNVTQIELYMKSAIESSERPSMIAVNVQGNMPKGSVLTVEVSNNALDSEPKWETYSPAVTGTYIFQNETKESQNWGVGVHIMLDRGSAIEVCTITSVGGNWKSN